MVPSICQGDPLFGKPCIRSGISGGTIALQNPGEGVCNMPDLAATAVETITASLDKPACLRYREIMILDPDFFTGSFMIFCVRPGLAVID